MYGMNKYTLFSCSLVSSPVISDGGLADLLQVVRKGLPSCVKLIDRSLQG